MTSSLGSEHATGAAALKALPPLRWRRLPLALFWLALAWTRLGWEAGTRKAER